jgi:hypothetical protein
VGQVDRQDGVSLPVACAPVPVRVLSSVRETAIQVVPRFFYPVFSSFIQAEKMQLSDKFSLMQMG